MSGQQWEVVTKNKKDKTANGAPRKLTKTEKKLFVENAPKVEDLLPMSMVKSLYSEIPEVKKPTADAKKGKENDAKKQQQKKAQQQQQQQKNEKEKAKESKPRTLDAAINRINAAEFQNMVALVKTKFEGSALMWLRTIDNFLDQSLNVEISDPVFSSKNHEYPLCLVPPALLSILKEALETAGEANIQLYFEVLLSHLAQELTKGLPAAGTRILLQLIATSYPKVGLAAIPKCIALQNSYKSRKPIWLSILWAMGQAGFKDLSVGLKVWQDVMLPILDMRNYSQYVVEYLTRLLGRHSASPALSVNEYLIAMDSILRPDVSISNLLTDSLQRQAKILRKIAVNATPDAKLNLFFKPLMDRLATADTDAYKEEILEFLYSCLCADNQCFSTWKQIYSSKLSESTALLEHIASKGNLSESKLAQKSCKSFIDFAVKTNASLQSSKHKVKGLEDSRKICEV